MNIVEVAQVGLERCVELYNHAFRDYPMPMTYSVPRLGRQFEIGILQHRYSLVAMVDQQPVGLLLAGNDTALPTIKIHAMAVVPGFRRQGIGRAMMQELKQRAREDGAGSLHLMVLEGNNSARAFYEAMDFAFMGRRSCYSLTLPARLPRGNNLVKIDITSYNHHSNLGRPALGNMLLARLGRRSVGYLVFSGEDILVIHTVYVVPRRRRRGIATSLLREALAQSPLAQGVRINFLSDEDQVAKRFLRKLGFRRYCRLHDMRCSL